MMNNKELFKNTFSQIHASEDSVSEVIKMKDKIQKRKSYAKKTALLVACVVCAFSAGIIVTAAANGNSGAANNSTVLSTGDETESSPEKLYTETAYGKYTYLDGSEKEMEYEVTYYDDGSYISTTDIGEKSSIIIHSYYDGGFEVTFIDEDDLQKSFNEKNISFSYYVNDEGALEITEESAD